MARNRISLSVKLMLSLVVSLIVGTVCNYYGWGVTGYTEFADGTDRPKVEGVPRLYIIAFYDIHNLGFR